MGVIQNLKLWKNNVTHIDANGNEVTEEVPRVMPPPPWKVVALLDLKAWLYFCLGLAAWTADGYDFNAVNLVATDLATVYGRDLSSITLSITLTLLFRSVGAVLFGIMSDCFGRKWPLSADLWILAGLQVATAYVTEFSSFIAIRAIFGVAMGGIWGLSAAMSMENMPVEARGLFSGLLQQGYALGYLIAAVVNITAVRYTSEGYKAIFHVGAGFTGLVALIVMFIPESPIFVNDDGENAGQMPLRHKVAGVWRDLKLASRLYWKIFLYCIALCMGFNWMSHGSQDIYPSYLKVQKGFSSDQASVATIIGQCGAIVGGAICGYYSQFFGRRLTVVVACCFGACIIPLWTIPNTWSPIVAGTFLIQAAVNGAWGIMPIFLNEYSPPQFRGVFPGTVYQIGNMLSSPAAQISTVAASNWIRDTPSGPKPNYSQVMTITMCIVFTACAIIMACGQERLGSRFEVVTRAGAAQKINPEDKIHSVEDGECETGLDDAVSHKEAPRAVYIEQV
ncbi:hypothetical protein N7499_009061 [Penicillium canescens]|uniref:Major facilitator superfamily (MFS) profile domain-containing protein n=1 Tax=Penicillium canescens TaxID=5083 RepID=A0AAD6NF27_PENCN|nr:uncharacterized protein N7446_008915 [Penicillium canescens]KAJ5981882.1 hypothetical protein N7522_013510 [Penicillium canescens]KAJ6032792.1 hypothetical protein N7444_010563 [Penicillium canescens]KAJ6058016.1 hypothetical protein N7460_001290 [Penicillium canescens]KAJ6059332.1 hypothetical protein N7446_008915 [Penicillium canescens]KAJ6071047.1 hypothetical protein N7499_009061 [Penicillium canescens]